MSISSSTLTPVSPSIDPRGSIEHSPVIPIDFSRVNTNPRRAEKAMTSQFESSYSNLQSHLSTIKGHVITQSDVITQFPSSSSSDQLFQLSSKAMAANLDIQSTMEDYKEVVESIEEGIGAIEDTDRKKEEEGLFASRMAGTDGATKLPFDRIALTSLLAKEEKRYTRGFEAAITRVASLARLSPKHPDSLCSAPSIDTELQAIPNHTTPQDNGSQSQVSTASPSLADLQLEIESLKSRMTISNHSMPTSQSLAQSQIPLPPLRIETFDGSNITLWSSFHSQFQSIIGCRLELSNLEKLNYLRSSLKGDALKLVQSIPIRDDLYAHTLDRLKVAYDRSNHSTAILYQKLMSLRPKTNGTEDQLNCVRDMINLVYHIDDSKNLDSLPLIQQMASRINLSFVRKIWKLNPSTMMDALTFIDKELREELELRAVERAFSSPNSVNPNPSSSSDGHRDRDYPREQHTRQSHERHKDTLKCDYCGSNHLPINCTKYKSIEDRSNRITHMKVCRRCLKSGHIFHECPITCDKCKDKHHESICRSNSTSNQPITQAAVVSSHHTWHQTRLHTTTGVIRNPVNRTAIDARIFLDAGSQVSMITPSLVKHLNLEPIDSSVMSFTGAGGTMDSELRDVVQFDLMTDTGIQPVTAVVMDTLPLKSLMVDALPTTDINFIEEKSISIPPSIVNAHTVYPEILLGIDVTHSLTKNMISTQLPSGLELVQSQLGPIIIGSKNPDTTFPIDSKDNPTDSLPPIDIKDNPTDSILTIEDKDRPPSYCLTIGSTIDSTERSHHEPLWCFATIIDPDDHDAQAERDERLDQLARRFFNADTCSEYEDDSDDDYYDPP